MDKNTIILSVILSVLLIAASSYYFTRELVEKTRYIGFQGEARENRFLAASEFLQSFELKSKTITIEELSKLDSGIDTLIIPSSRITMTKTNNDQLLKWIESGGHLITITRKQDNKSKQRRDLLLDPYEVYSYEPQAEEFSLVETKEKLNIDSDYTYRLSIPNVARKNLLQDELGYLAYQLSIKKGKITVFNNLSFIRNHDIDKQNHAEALRLAVFFNHQPKSVWIVKREVSTGLVAWLWNNAWQFMFAIFVFIIFALLYAGQRLGPITVHTQQTRRRMTEHIKASAWFLWKHKMSEELLNANRTTLIRYIHKNHPSVDTQSWDGLARFLSETGIATEEDIKWALQLKSTTYQSEFVKAIQLYERIRKII